MHILKTAKFAVSILILSVPFILVQSCQEELPSLGPPNTGREWVEASARYHDPTSRWQAFEGSIEVETRAPSGGGYSNSIYLNRVLDTFSRTIQSGGFPLVQVVGPSGCGATWPNPDATAAQLLRNGLKEDPCRYILPRFDYYEFLMGIPMVALEGDISFRKNPDLVDAFGTDCVEVELTFPDGNSNGGGDWLSYEDDVAVDGFLLKKSQRWYRLDGETELVLVFLEFKHWGFGESSKGDFTKGRTP